MRWMRTALRELVGLFVDDGSLALATLIWLAIAWLALGRFGLTTGWAGPVLFLGLALILIESALRRARTP